MWQLIQYKLWLLLFVQVLRSLKINVKTFACVLENVKNIYFLKYHRRNPYNFMAIFPKTDFLAEQTFIF